MEDDGSIQSEGSNYCNKTLRSVRQLEVTMRGIFDLRRVNIQEDH